MYGIWNRVTEEWWAIKGELYHTSHKGVASAQLLDILSRRNWSTKELEIREFGDKGMPK